MKKNALLTACVVVALLLSAGSTFAQNTVDWRYGRPGVLVVTNAPSRAELSAAASAGTNYVKSVAVTNSGTATLSSAALGSLSVSGHTKLGVMAANSAGGNAQGSLQAGWNDSLMGSWYVNSLGAWQIGYTGETTGIAVTNLGAGAVQIFSLNSPNQKALTTSGGGGSLLLGAGVSSNEHAIVAGSGGYSHGAGSITATGGFWGSGIGLTDIRDLLAITNFSSPTLTGLSLRRYTNAIANAYTINQVSGAPASALGRYDYKATSVYTNGLGWQIYVETSPLFTVYVSSLPPLGSGTYSFMSGAVPRNSSSGGGIGTGTIQLNYAYGPAAYSSTILSTNGIEGAALRTASVPSSALSTAPLYPTGDGSRLTGLTASQISGLPTGGSSSTLVPIVAVTTGAFTTVTWSATPQINYIDLYTQTTITNSLPTLNCTSNMSTVLRINAAVTNACNPLWDPRIDWQNGQPEMTCTGLYEFVFSSACGTRIQGRQTWPTRYEWRNIGATPAGVITASSPRYSLLNIGVPINTSTNSYGVVIPYKDALVMVSCYGGNVSTVPVMVGAGRGTFLAVPATPSLANMRMIGDTGPSASDVYFVSPARTTKSQADYIMVSGTGATTTSAQIMGVFCRQLNELEIAAYAAGWRP